jgi:hypothetical protein
LGYLWAGRIAERRILRGRKVRLPRLFEAYCYLFQTGAVLGRAQSRRAERFAELFAEPGRGADLANGLREAGEKLRTGSTSDATFLELATKRFTQTIGIDGTINEVLKLGNEWASTDTAARLLCFSVVEGVGLGVAFPDFVEELWRKSYETNDPLKDRIRQELGFEEEQPFTLEEFEQQALMELAAFVRAYYPSLVQALNLAIPAGD